MKRDSVHVKFLGQKLKIRTAAMNLICTMFHAEFVGVYTTHLHAKFRLPIYNDHSPPSSAEVKE
jgi:hypothetical protein